MSGIGGNIIGVLQVKQTGEKNSIGEADEIWIDAFSQIGWLGMQTGDSDRINFNAKLEKSTHVFLCDYDPAIYAVADSDMRMVLKGKMYDVLLVDNPDEMNEQLEIYLRYIGGQ